MLAGFKPGGVNVLEWAAVILFFFNFGWLATASLTGVAGTISLLKTKNWRKIAEVYNGRDNVDEYAPRLATEYQRLRRYYEQ